MSSQSEVLFLIYKLSSNLQSEDPDEGEAADDVEEVLSKLQNMWPNVNDEVVAELESEDED